VEAKNNFMRFTYEGEIDLENESMDEMERDSIRSQVQLSELKRTLWLQRLLLNLMACTS
jgi:hypothetical protein